MDFLHTDPATGDQFTVSVNDGGAMPSFAERQAAVAQYRAATQGTQGAGAQAASGYGYAPLNSGNAAAQASAPSSGSGGGYGQDAWNPPSWAGLGYGGFGDGGSYGSYPFQVPQPYSGDPNNSPALQMLRARAAEAAQRQAAAPPVSPVMLPKAAASGQDSAAGDGATADPWSWQNWLLGNEPQAAAAASSGIPSVGTSSWLDWLQNTEPQAQDDAAKPTLPATSTPAQVDVGTLPVDKPGAPATPQPIPVDGFPGLKYTMTMMPVPREETSSPLQTTAGRAVTGGTATPGAAASADSGWGNSMPGQALGGSASASAGTFFTGPMPSLDTGAMPGTAGTGPFSRASSQPATGQTGGNPSANHPSAGEVEAQRLYGRPLTPVERSLASRLTPQEVRDRIGSTQPVAQPVGRPPANGEIRAAPHNSFVPFGARTGQPFGDFADSLRQAWTLDRAGYAPNTNAIDRYVRPLVDDVAATVGQYTTIPANYVQGALAAGLRRYDAVAADLPSSTNPFSNALTESGYLFDTGDGAQGEIAARDMTGARRIGESVPELGENTVAGTLYNGGVRAGLDPTNFLFVPEKAISMPVTVVEALERARLAEEGAGTVAKAQALYNTATAGPSLAERAYTGVSGAVKAGAQAGRELALGASDSWKASRGYSPIWDGEGNRAAYGRVSQPEPLRWTRPLQPVDPSTLKRVGPIGQADPFAPPAADFMPSVSEATSPAMLRARLEIARAQARQAASLVPGLNRAAIAGISNASGISTATPSAYLRSDGKWIVVLPKPANGGEVGSYFVRANSSSVLQGKSDAGNASALQVTGNRPVKPAGDPNSYGGRIRAKIELAAAPLDAVRIQHDQAAMELIDAQRKLSNKEISEAEAKKVKRSYDKSVKELKEAEENLRIHIHELIKSPDPLGEFIYTKANGRRGSIVEGSQVRNVFRDKRDYDLADSSRFIGQTLSKSVAPNPASMKVAHKMRPRDPASSKRHASSYNKGKH